MELEKSEDAVEADALWYKDAIIYEVPLRAFKDSNGDGIGDLRGLTASLDYVQGLGVTAIWLLPFYPSPMKDDGYDISDFTDVHPDCGTLTDFKLFLKEAHRRGLRVITELVLNHTSDQHPWFQRARRSPPDSKWRNFYVWSDTPDKYKDARIIFKDFEQSNWAWDPIAKAYYWHRFYSHQPDLNYDSPDVRKTIFQIMDFWFELGVDGLRLDAVPYLFEREGTNCENLPETHTFLKELRRHLESRFKDRMLIAEANQWPEDIVAYFGDGDECHVCFNFPVMPRLFMAIRREDRFPIVEIIQRTPHIPENCQWALFLRNHDELSLEMVTDEERDFMYRIYAADPQARINLGIRRRLAPLMENDRKKIELMTALLFSLPGTPVVYYGDEIGMGDNYYIGDRNGVRTPMQWNAGRNAGFSDANPQRLYLPAIIDPQYHYEAINVEALQSNPHSLLAWMKRLIAARTQSKAFGRGRIEVLNPKNQKTLAFTRRFKEETVLVIANLSQFVQYTELDLSSLRGMSPVEFFGRSRFPTIEQTPYPISLGPYEFLWFVLEADVTTKTLFQPPTPSMHVNNTWEMIFSGASANELAVILAGWIIGRRWFGGKARNIHDLTVVDAISMPRQSPTAYFTVLNLTYVGGEPERYLLPLSHRVGARSPDVLEDEIARLYVDREGVIFEEGGLYDAASSKDFASALLETIAHNRRLKGKSGQILGAKTQSASSASLSSRLETPLEARVLKGEQTNTSIVYGNDFILKILRRLEAGVNPELQMGRFLSEEYPFANVPAVLGYLEYRPTSGSSITLAILHEYTVNVGDGWQFTLEQLKAFYNKILTAPPGYSANVRYGISSLTAEQQEPPATIANLIGSYLNCAGILGQRTGELHAALGQDYSSPDFRPEPFSPFYQQALYHEMIRTKDMTFQLLRGRIDELPEDVRANANRVLALDQQIEGTLKVLRERSISGARIRTHGDYHLSQVLYTGKDFVIIDFEGEPARAFTERRNKHSPLRDVASMIRSFQYASYVAISHLGKDIASKDRLLLESWADTWMHWVTVNFLRSYFSVMGKTKLIPGSLDETNALLQAYVADKAIYELRYELNNRPDWAIIPLKGILGLFSQTD